MSKAGDSIYDQWRSQEPNTPSREFTLAKIRARRDEIMDVNNKNGWNGLIEFARLFDDGALFGPDKPEPEYVARHNPDRTVSMIIDGRDVACQMSENCFNAIKKLGREEAGE